MLKTLIASDNTLGNGEIGGSRACNRIGRSHGRVNYTRDEYSIQMSEKCKKGRGNGDQNVQKPVEGEWILNVINSSYIVA